jgi:hypothetical protein
MAGTASGGEARIYGPTTYSSFEGDAEPVISLRMKVSAGTLSRLYFHAVGVPFGQATRVDFVPIADGQWHSYEVDMSGNANWAGQRVYRLRLDPTNAVGASFAVDWIRTTEPEQQPLRALLTTLNPEILRLHAADADPYGIQWREVYSAEGEKKPHGFTGQEDESFDNGSPMKAETMLATLQRLGVMPSFSRPKVSDDNAFSESLFRTLKYIPFYPQKPFASIEDARVWVHQFVAWYNQVHRHSGLKFVTPPLCQDSWPRGFPDSNRQRVDATACHRVSGSVSGSTSLTWRLAF